MKTTIPLKEKERIASLKRDVHIRLLYKLGFSMNEIYKEVRCSKSTVFRAVHKGRRGKNNK